MLSCSTYRPQQLRTAYHCGSVGVSSVGGASDYAYSHSTAQTFHTQCYNAYGYTAPQKLGWMSTSNQLLTGAPMPELELSHSAC